MKIIQNQSRSIRNQEQAKSIKGISNQKHTKLCAKDFKSNQTEFICMKSKQNQSESIQVNQNRSKAIKSIQNQSKTIEVHQNRSNQANAIKSN